MSRVLPEYNSLMRYTINDVCNWLAENRFGEFVRMFREHGIDGNRFVTLTDLDLSRMSCPMNKRKDLVKLIKELPKQTESRVKGMVQPQVPVTPSRDYNVKQGRPPAPIPATNTTSYDSGSSSSEDEVVYGSDFDEDDFDSDSEEDYLNAPGAEPPMDIPNRPQHHSGQNRDILHQKDHMTGSSNSIVDLLKTALITRQKTARRHVQEDQEDSDSAGSYEEPDTQIQPPPPSLPRRGGQQVAQPRSANNAVPLNRRPQPQMPPPQEDQPVYEDPEEEKIQVKKTGRKLLPIPDNKTSSTPRKSTPSGPFRTTSEPEAPAPPPPRGKVKQPPKMNKRSDEQSAPAPPPPRGGRKQAQPPPEPEEPQDFYEDPDNPPQPPAGRKTSGPPKLPAQDDLPQEVYEDPDATPVKQSIRSSALPPIPTEARQSPMAAPVEQEVYEDPDAGPPQLPPSRTKASLPPHPKTPKAPVHKAPPNVKNAPPPKQDDFQQLEYEVPDELMKGEMPQDDYMEMQPTPEEKKQINKKIKGIPVIPMNGEPKSTLPPRPGKNKQLPAPPVETATPAADTSTKPSSRKSSEKRPLPQPVDKTVRLEDQPWYHGDIERPVADSKLMGVGTNGCYLIRRSKKGGNTKPYTLAIIYEGQVFNLNIRKKENNNYALGMAKTNEQEFQNLPELVDFFQSHRLILAKGQTRLKKPCPK